MRIGDGAIVSRFSIAEGAFAAAFDGANVWLTDTGTAVRKM